MEELVKMLALFPEKECPNINSAFRKMHANLMFRSERAVVSISGGADSDMMLDMIRALEPEKNYPFDTIRYAWFDTVSAPVIKCKKTPRKKCSLTLG